MAAHENIFRSSRQVDHQGANLKPIFLLRGVVVAVGFPFWSFVWLVFITVLAALLAHEVCVEELIRLSMFLRM